MRHSESGIGGTQKRRYCISRRDGVDGKKINIKLTEKTSKTVENWRI